MVRHLFSFLRTTSFMVMLCVTLVTTTTSLAIWTISLTSQVATMTAGAAATLLQHRKAIAAAVARTKAKARLRRTMAAVPLVGMAAVGYFEHRDFQEWKQENPDGDWQDYGCEVGTVSAQVIDEVLQELPEEVRPGRDLVLSQLPACDAPPSPGR